MRVNPGLIAALFLAFPLSTALAQFDGGFGDGSDGSQTIQVTLDGVTANVFPMYQGGVADGAGNDLVNTTLAGQPLAQIFNGGVGDGHNKSAFSGVIDGATLNQLYGGGDGDGHDNMTFNGLMNGTALTGLFDGGDGDGHSSLRFTGVVNGTSLDALYSGGDGDGFDRDKYTGTTDGTELSVMFTGGQGDGHDTRLHASVMDGSDISVMFSGGEGDGHDEVAQQFIFDFPRCTFVVNTDDTGFGSLRYALDCAQPGDTITFSPLYLQNDTIQLTSSQIEIFKEVDVEVGQGQHITIDGSQIGRVFKIGNVGEFKISGLRIIAGSNIEGAAIQNDGLLTLVDIVLIGPDSASILASTNLSQITIEGTLIITTNQ